MAWIETIGPERAKGLLAQLYAAAVARAGRVFQVLRLQSVRPRVLAASTRLYTELMHAPDGPLTRAQREMIATTVSRINQCHY
jgi:alkylhydroperoxidase family enzyme